MIESPNQDEVTAALIDEAIKNGRVINECRAIIEAMLPESPVGSHQLIALHDVATAYRIAAKLLDESGRRTNRTEPYAQRLARIVALQVEEESHIRDYSFRQVSIVGYSSSMRAIGDAAGNICLGFEGTLNPVESTADCLESIIEWSLLEVKEENEES